MTRRWALVVSVLCCVCARACRAQCNLGGMNQVCSSNPPPGGDNVGVQELCQSPCVQAMMTCAGDPSLTATVGEDEAATVQSLAQTCTTLPTQTERPGDGNCDIAKLGQYGREHEQAYGGAQPDCDSDVLQELFDCLHEPAFQSQVGKITALQSTCDSVTGASCLAQWSNAHEWIIAGGLCCPPHLLPLPEDRCNEADRGDNQHPPPNVCTANCAAAWNPFWDSCGSIITSLLVTIGENSIAPQLASFVDMCRGGTGGGGH